MTFDLIIVGAGTAGCVLAERLTASGGNKVLLLEAGGRPASSFVRIPAGFAKLFKSKLDWNFESAPQTDAGRRIYIPRGRMLGGCSNMNAQIHQWGHPRDFDGWAEGGAHGWSWADVAPVFRAQERLNGAASEARGTAGVMHVEPNAHAHPLSHAFVAAARASGLPTQGDYNGGAFEGAWIPELAHRAGRRFSAYDAFLKPALARPGLSVETEAQALRILFDGTRAVGVEAHVKDGRKTFRARRGIVLAAGAFGTPHVLLCSGIGPGAALRSLGIDVVRDAPGVGANLHDHPMAGLVFSCRRQDTLKNAESPFNLLRYLALRRGPLASNAIEGIAFARSDGRGANAPDIELLFAPFEWRNQGLEPPKVHAFSIAAAVVAPRSRGALSIASADTRDPPVIDFGLLSDPDGHDAAALLAGLKLVRRIAALPPLAADAVDEIDPGHAAQSDDALLAWAKTRLQTVYHPAGTCRMGSDEDAVATPQLSVRGVEGLWVADASVMPTAPRGHPNAAVAMLAHRAADFVRSAAPAA